METQDSWEAVEKACRDAGLASPITPRELEIMKLIGTTSVDRLVHDVRNLLNENTLLRAVADLGDKG